MGNFILGLFAGIVVGLVMEWVIDWTGLTKRSIAKRTAPSVQSNVSNQEDWTLSRSATTKHPANHGAQETAIASRARSEEGLTDPTATTSLSSNPDISEE